MELGVKSGPLVVPLIPELGEIFMGLICVNNGEVIGNIRVVGIGDAVGLGPHFKFSALLQEFISCGDDSFDNRFKGVIQVGFEVGASFGFIGVMFECQGRGV